MLNEGRRDEERVVLAFGVDRDVGALADRDAPERCIGGDLDQEFVGLPVGFPAQATDGR